MYYPLFNGARADTGAAVRGGKPYKFSFPKGSHSGSKIEQLSVFAEKVRSTISVYFPQRTFFPFCVYAVLRKISGHQGLVTTFVMTLQ
jgi:hypothetical protein